MKSSLGKLRRFALHKGEVKGKQDYQSTAHVDELAQASQDMQDMRNCYDSLLSAAAATANSAYEFSESLQEMGACLLEKTALNDDERTGRVLLLLGRVQFELQKLVDSYRSHIFLTITTPSESLLNELRTVEEMKQQCEEKRGVYEYMMAQQREKGRSKIGKGETFTAQQLQTAHDEYEEEATLCVFRLKSLKQGQSRSLLTQAARHHAAQLNFFRKGLKSLEAVEPHVRRFTEEQHIDYQFTGLEDEDGEVEEYDGENDDDASDGGELSFEYRENKQGLEVVSTSRNSMELEQSDISFGHIMVDDSEVNPDKSHGEIQEFYREAKGSYYSAPIVLEKKIDPAEKNRQMQQLPSRRFHAYALPTPDDAKSSTPVKASYSVPGTRSSSHITNAHNLWHSTPLEPNRREKDSGDDNYSGLSILKGQSVLTESKNTTQLPPPLTEGLQHSQIDVQSTSGSKKFKRQAVSGPLIGKSTELPQLVSGLLTRVPNQTLSPKVSPTASPPLTSSPRISELHELPRPPGISSIKTVKSPSLVGHSAPLAYRIPELFTTKSKSPVVSSVASPLPTPPSAVQRSYSIPSHSQRATALQVSRLSESAQTARKSFDEAASHPTNSHTP